MVYKYVFFLLNEKWYLDSSIVKDTQELSVGSQSLGLSCGWQLSSYRTHGLSTVAQKQRGKLDSVLPILPYPNPWSALRH